MGTKILPGLMMIEAFAAAAVYAACGDWRRALYWFAASLITLAVTL